MAIMLGSGVGRHEVVVADANPEVRFVMDASGTPRRAWGEGVEVSPKWP